MADKRFSFWVSLSAAFQAEFKAYILNDTPPTEFPLIADIAEVTVEVFATVYDEGAMDRLYRKWGGRDYRMWSCYANKPEGTQQVKADFDMLSTAYPVDFGILGAWHYEDGRPVGTQWTDDEPPELTGDPWYVQPAQTVNFMPDIVVDDTDPENPVYGRPTEVTDVLLLLGQPPRTFTPEA